MRYVEVERETANVREFVRALAADRESIVIQLNGKSLLRVLPIDAVEDKERSELLQRARELLERARRNSPQLSAREAEKIAAEAVDEVRARKSP